VLLRFGAEGGSELSLLRFLVAWGNAPYTVALGIVGLFALLQTSGLLGLLAGGGHDVGDGGADGHDIDADADVEADADVGADHDGTGDDADADHDGDDADHDEGGGRSFTGAILAPLGVGKMPFSLVWQVYGVVFAFVGLGINAEYVTRAAGPSAGTLWWTLPAALSAGYAAVAGLARLLSPIFATRGQEATRRSELVGRIGTVISTKVDEAFGEVRIRDKTGHDIRIICKLAAEHRPAREGEEVIVVEHDDETGALFVARLDEGLETGRRKEPMTKRRDEQDESMEQSSERELERDGGGEGSEGEEGKGAHHAAT